MENFDYKGFWKDSKESKRDWILEMPTEEEISIKEQSLHYKLPKSYVELMKFSHNGGLLKRNAFIKRNDKNEVVELYKIDYIEAINKLMSREEMNTFPGLASLPEVGVYFGSHIDGRERFALDYTTNKEEPSVCVILYSQKEKKYYPKTIASNFKEFVCSLGILEKPDPFDFEALRESVKVTAKKTFTGFKKYTKEKIIAFGLYTDSEGKFIAPAINTEDHLLEQFKEYPEEKDYYIYSTNEWKYEGGGTGIPQEFEEIDNQIIKYWVYLNTDGAKRRFRKQLLDTCVYALLDLKKEGLFSEELILMVNISDEEISKAHFKKIKKELNG